MHVEMNEAYSELSMEDIRIHWHGALAALDGLAQYDDNPVPELVIDTRYEHIGLPYQLFGIPSPELRNFETVCQRLRRLDLAVNTFPTFGNLGLRQLHCSQLPRVLAAATSLESFSLHTSCDGETHESESDKMELLSLLPVDSWPLLRHITLSSIRVGFEDLVQLFKRLRKRLKSVQLINVRLATGKTYKSLLETCRDELHWVTGSPKFNIGQSPNDGMSEARIRWIEEEINNFLAGKGPNPFAGSGSGNFIKLGYGTLRDYLQP